MAKQALYLKWRPQAFDDVIGQEHIVRTLLNAIQAGRVRHAYLFSGPRGTGKTTTARLLASAMGSQNLDVIEIDAASHTSVDDVRDLRDKIAFMPAEGQYKVYIIDEVHRFSGSAFDALLKTLEEPPAHAVFILATTEIDKVPDTIKSRCLQFEFRRVPLKQVADRLQQIAESEGVNIAREALELIARHGTGSVRDSISLLDQIVADPEEHITLEVAERILGTARSSAVLGVVEALLLGDSAAGIYAINEAIDSGSDPRQFGGQIVEHLRNVLLAQTATSDLIEASSEMRQLYQRQSAQINKAALLRALRAFNDAIADSRSGWQPQLALELAFVEALLHRQEGRPESVSAGASPAAALNVFELEAAIERILSVRGVPAGTASKGNVAAPEPAVLEPVHVDQSAPPAVPMSEIVARWSETREAVGVKSRIFAPVLDHVEVRSVNGDVVTLVVQNKLFLEKLSNAENRSILNLVLSRIHGVTLKVNPLMGGEASSKSASLDVNDPIVNASREYGGTIRNEKDRKK
ncbi:MAG: DNA polymerase III subunit gamma/tau [Phototrophicaceae bacterium]